MMKLVVFFHASLPGGGLGGKGDAVIPNIGGSRGTASEKF